MLLDRAHRAISGENNKVFPMILQYQKFNLMVSKVEHLPYNSGNLRQDEVRKDARMRPCSDGTVPLQLANRTASLSYGA